MPTAGPRRVPGAVPKAGTAGRRARARVAVLVARGVDPEGRVAGRILRGRVIRRRVRVGVTRVQGGVTRARRPVPADVRHHRGGAHVPRRGVRPGGADRPALPDQGTREEVPMGSLARHRVASSANPPGLDWQPIDSIEYSRYGILTL